MAPIAIPIALVAASFISGLIKKKSSATQTSTSTSTPSFDPAFMGLRDKLLASAQRGLSGGGGYSMAHNITNTNLQGIGNAGNAASQGLAARLSSMGIRGGAAANPLAQLQGQVFGQQVGAINQEPLLAHQFDQESLQNAFNVLGLGRGMKTTGTGASTGVNGGGVGGGLDNVAGILGLLYGQGAFGGAGAKSVGGGAGAFGGGGW